MSLSIKYHLVPGLPKLARLTCLNQETLAELSVFHGSSVPQINSLDSRCDKLFENERA